MSCTLSLSTSEHSWHHITQCLFLPFPQSQGSPYSMSGQRNVRALWANSKGEGRQNQVCVSQLVWYIQRKEPWNTKACWWVIFPVMFRKKNEFLMWETMSIDVFQFYLCFFFSWSIMWTLSEEFCSFRLQFCVVSCTSKTFVPSSGEYILWGGKTNYFEFVHIELDRNKLPNKWNNLCLLDIDPLSLFWIRGWLMDAGGICGYLPAYILFRGFPLQSKQTSSFTKLHTSLPGTHTMLLFYYGF